MSKIEWTDKTWNPIIGCTKVSPACDNCYAEKMACRLAQMEQTAASYGEVVGLTCNAWNGRTYLVESALGKPLHWRKPCRVFVGSMTDLFHKETPDEWLDKIFAVMAMTPHITYQILTKRPEGMREYMNKLRYGVGFVDTPLAIENENAVTQWLDRGMPNVWLGVTVENQQWADHRIPILLDTPASVRFVSVEPMLGPVRLDILNFHQSVLPSAFNALLGGETLLRHGEWDFQFGSDGAFLDWVICGGETGHGARPMHPDWACDLLMQCESEGVPFFFKKWGSYKGLEDWRIPGGEKIGGKIVREFPTVNGGAVDES